jgi:hypothetical protein
MAVHEDTFRGFKERGRTQPTSVVFPNPMIGMGKFQWDAVYLNNKYKIGYEKYLQIIQKQQVRKVDTG